MSNLIALPEGTELVGDYRIKRVLGAGGFGITYLADEVSLDRVVTIKEYFPSDFAARTPELDAAPRSQDCSGDYTWGLDRFIDEAQALAKFNHPNIVKVYRYFRANNTGYMVLHFEQGQSLKTWLKKLGRAPRQNELDPIVEKLLNALEVVHNGDFLHRDIAPDNIILRANGDPVLIDFGSARGEIAKHSKTVSALVKPGYSPFEQYAETSRQQGPWTDIYALGATLYHAITGKRPPDSPSRMVNDEFIPASDAVRASYRPSFIAAIEKALLLPVKKRPQSVAAWRRQLFADEQKTRAGWLINKDRKKSPEKPQPKYGPFPLPLGAKPRRFPKPYPPEDMASVEAAGHTLSEALARASKDAADRANDNGSQQVKKNAADSKEAARAATQKLATDYVPPPSPIKRKKNPPKATKPDASEPKTMGFWKRKQQPADGLAKEANKKKAAPKKRSVAKPKAKTKKPAAKVDTAVAVVAPTPLRPVARKNSSTMLPVRRAPKPVALRRNKKSRSFGKTLKRYTAIAATVVLTAWIAPQLSNLTGLTQVNNVAELGRTSNISTGSTKRALLRQIKISDRPIAAVAYTDDGRWLVTATQDNKIHIYWTRGGGHVRTISLNNSGRVTAMALFGRRALTGHADGHLALWNLDTSERIAQFHRNDASIHSVVFAGQANRFLAASHDWKIALWDARSNSLPAHVFDAHENATQAVAYSAEKNTFASGSADKTVKLWRLDTLDTSRTYRRLSDFVTALDFRPGGRELATATLDGKIRILRTARQRVVKVLRGHRDAVTDIAYAPGGASLASSSKDGTIRFWNLKTGRTTRTFASHSGKISSLSFSPDGERLVSAGDDGVVRIWSVPAGKRISLR